ncbi:hypothetical protein L0U85_00030 [Glycomyces sp. L485]|uniref:hypothetical protein n=1 Tax=Glycomyces sp. L485 TaxID=2909235 RepID=UPI001F4A14F8|nr:hypothetical protein [Glycomyces sp. L485]MCH7229261.1 hypothetical protein [Glycomyces sp. L485]
MSRTVGPYNDVSTARVEGAYELCEGADATGRPVQILTLGSASSKDPARRGLLSDTVAWAYATAGPEDAPILVADLEAEQPYVVVLHDARLRGADRIMDRLLALGPATGPLPVGPGAASHRPQSPASPAGPPSAPPMSPPTVVIAPPKRRSQLLPILIGVLSVIVIVALLVLGGWLIRSTVASGDDASGSAPADADTSFGEAEEAPEGAAEEGQEAVPQWIEGASDLSVAGTLFGPDDDTNVVALKGWPLAFRVPAEYRCEPADRSIVCTAPDGSSTVEVAWEVCQAPCDDAARESLQEALPYQPLQAYENGDIGFAVREPFGKWKASLSVFVDNAGTILHVSAVADVATELAEDAQPILNDVLNQAKSLEE